MPSSVPDFLILAGVLLWDVGIIAYVWRVAHPTPPHAQQPKVAEVLPGRVTRDWSPDDFV